MLHLFLILYPEMKQTIQFRKITAPHSAQPADIDIIRRLSLLKSRLFFARKTPHQIIKT